MLFLFVLKSISFVDATPYTLPITRKGETHTMVASSWWGGEYPMPIITVASSEDVVVVQGYSSLRKLEQLKKCTVPVGLYHPWATKKSTVDSYYTISPLVKYELTKDNLEEKLRKGDVLDMELYLGENFCSYQLKSGKKTSSISISCDLVVDDKMKKITGATHSQEQWLYLNCTEGYKVFISDQELLKQTGNLEGQICGYGMVATSTEECSEASE